MSKKLLAGLLSIALVLSAVSPAGLQVQASGLDVAVETTAEDEELESQSASEETTEVQTENVSEMGESESASREEDTENEEVSEEVTETESAESVTETETEITTETTVIDETVVETETPVVDETVIEAETEIVTEEESADVKLTFSDSDIAHGTYEDITWVIDANGKLTVEGTGEFSEKAGTERDRAPWYRYSLKITSADVFISGIKDVSYMFYNCCYMTDLNVDNLDTADVTSMSGMFWGCSKLTSLDIGGFDTTNVTNMSRLFNDCYGLTSLDVSNFDTTNVKDMSYVFNGCYGLTSLDVSNFKTANVTDMSYMFSSCHGLTSLDVSKLDTANVTDMSFMFSGCSNFKLTCLDVSNFDTTNVTDMSGMFSGCYGLTSLDVSKLDTTNVTDMSGMFSGCHGLTSLDVSKLDTANVTDMSGMFGSCSRLVNLDLSNFDTVNVTDMSGMFSGCVALKSLNLKNYVTTEVTSMYKMFSGCWALKSLDLSHFDTTNVTNMGFMFEECKALESLDISSFDTSNVTNMESMFDYCFLLPCLDLSHFDTTNVTDMSSMFGHCEKLTSLNISSFDTTNVTDMTYMFLQCFALKNLDVSNFDTSNVIGISRMFESCSSLTSLDLSSFDMEKGYSASTWFYGCSKLKTIYTPRNLQDSVGLPKTESNDVWYKADGSTITELPINLSYSIVIAKNKVPEVPDPYITATKDKTDYICGETVSANDITVTYYDSNGAATKITEGYTTNAEEIDMSTPGKKELVVTYNELTAKVELSVTYLLKTEEVEVTLAKTEYTYNGREQKPVPEVTIKESGEKLTAGEDYSLSYKNNVHTGAEAKIVVTGANDYSGMLEMNFTIVPAELVITAKDKICAMGGQIPSSADFGCRVSGLFGTDKLLVEPTFTCLVADMSITGTYPIIPSGADAGANYMISYVNGTLTVQEEMVIYTVSFDMMGHGEAVLALTGIKAGSLIKAPTEPTAEGYVFGGWFKDRACTKAWDFAVDTVQEDTTLYACWIMKAQTPTGLCVQEITDVSYTGSALKPALRVYAADGVTLLKSGKDYTVKYYNSTAADTEEERTLGGVNTTGKEGEGGFTESLAYVVITGKGDYSGAVYRNFHILPASIGDGGEDMAVGIVLKYNDQLVVNTKKSQKVVNSIKYKKNLKAGTDYTVTITAVEAYDQEGNAIAQGSVVDSGSAAAVPAGYSGIFTMKVEGIGNYTGSIVKEIHVSDKTHLMKNAKITLGKNLKKAEYQDGGEITLTPGYYDAKTKKYYVVCADGTLENEAMAKGDDVFTVKAGNTYLLYGKDYLVSYENNFAVGKAVMTITGIGEYSGSKSTNFTITGKPFNAKNVIVGEDFKSSVPYTGRPQTQNHVTLTTKTGEPLEYGIHYTIRYSNNLKKGKAVMQFSAKPESGYSGSFSVKFNITAPALLDAADIVVTNQADSIIGSNGVYTLNAEVPYSKNGSVLTDKIQLISKTADTVLKEGTDYTVKYAGNKVVTTSETAEDKLPVMTIKGKGNYAGSLQVRYRISEASFTDNGELTVTVTATAFNAGKNDEYQYQPKIKVAEQKKTLNGKKDYTVTEYRNCKQPEVKEYFTALTDGTKTAQELENMKPKAVITALSGSGYKAGESRTVDLPIFMTKLSSGNVYVVISEENTTYTGSQITPDIAVYYGDNKAVKAAKNAKETDSSVLIDAAGAYKLIKLTVSEDYTVSYGANIKAGKNKGTVTITGTGLYGGSVTTKFTIKNRNIY